METRGLQIKAGTEWEFEGVCERERELVWLGLVFIVVGLKLKQKWAGSQETQFFPRSSN